MYMEYGDVGKVKNLCLPSFVLGGYWSIIGDFTEMTDEFVFFQKLIFTWDKYSF